MNENEVPSLEKIVATFSKRCREQNYTEEKLPDACAKCKMPSGAASFCIRHYIYAILTDKMKLTDSFKKEEPKPTLPPSWCTEGFWVTDNDCKVSSIYEVVDSNATTAKCRRHSAFSFEHQDFEIPVAKLKPVMFMPYTEEQAERIVRLGMIIYITTTLGNKIIERAERSAGKDDLFDSINAISVTRFGYVIPNTQRALIGGIPLGVPKVNEEALQKGNWE